MPLKNKLKIDNLAQGQNVVLLAFSVLYWFGGTFSVVFTLPEFEKAPLVIGVSLGLPSLILLSVLVLAVTKRLDWAAKYFLAALYVNILFIVVTLGGVLATTSLHLILLPLLAAFLLGRNWAIGTAGLVVATTVALYVFRGSVGVPLHGLNADALAYSMAFTICAATLGAVGASYVYDLVTTSLTTRLAKANQQALAMNNAKSRFLASMSHEIRTPMNGMTVALSLLSERSDIPDDARAQIKLALRSGTALMTILDDVLDLSKLEAGRMSLDHFAFMPRKEVEDVILLHDTWAQDKRVALKGRVGVPRALQVVGDAPRLRQILTNLLSNTIHVMEQGGVIVEARVAPAKPDRWTLIIDITDTGEGLTADTRAGLVQRFKTADLSASHSHAGDTGHGDAGLGLAIAKEVVGMMDGAIEADLSDGTLFRLSVTLPEAKPIARTDRPARRDWGASLSGLNVLVVEDDKTNQIVIGSILETLDCRMGLASNGFEAIGRVQGEAFDLILLDVEMPGMDGLQALEEIRKLGPGYEDLPVIAVTARAMAGDRERFIGRGVDGYVSKPFEAATLVTEMRRVLGVTVPATPATRKEHSVSGGLRPR